MSSEHSWRTKHWEDSPVYWHRGWRGLFWKLIHCDGLFCIIPAYTEGLLTNATHTHTHTHSQKTQSSFFCLAFICSWLNYLLNTSTLAVKALQKRHWTQTSKHINTSNTLHCTALKHSQSKRRVSYRRKMKDFEKAVPLLLARRAGGGGGGTESPQPREPREGGKRGGRVSSNPRKHQTCQVIRGHQRSSDFRATLMQLNISKHSKCATTAGIQSSDCRSEDDVCLCLF